jgi:predicted outer membrane protein
MEYPAVKLFRQSAKRVQPTFDLQPDDREHAVRICQLTDGMPLGIELAAAWANVLSLQEFADESTRTRATSARSAEVRKLSSTGASTVREHLTLAQQVGSQVGVSSTAGRVGGVPAPAPTTTTDDRTNAKNGEDHNNADNNANNNEHASLGAADRAFVDNVLRDHLMHIRLAKQAQHQGSDEVKDLAERIEKDFTKWSERWESFADKRDAEVSSKLQPHNKEKLDRLNKAKDREEFDRAYADLVADHLELMVQDFKAAGERTQTPAVQRLAKDELPVIRDLHSRAQRLDREESSDKK